MKILSSEEIRKADAYTIKHEPIKSINLMERAAKSCVKWIVSSTSVFTHESEVKIFCGMGNNGGDGLAIARLLSEKKFKVEVFIIRHSDKCSENFLINENRLKKIKRIKVYNVTSTEELKSITFHPNSIIIDALFGSGLNKPVEGLAKQVIELINRSNCLVVSVDIPSGMFSEENFHKKGQAIVRTHYTLSFQVPKLAFMFPENEEYTGRFLILNIGLNEEFIAGLDSKNYFVTLGDVRKLLKPRNKFSHKGSFGHSLIVSGSYGKMGACVLASRACISAGAGLVTAHIPKCGYIILQTANPEVMIETDSSDKIISDIIHTEKYNSIGIGPGIGTEKETQNVLKIIIQNTRFPLVIDADALNILSENKTWLSFLPKNTILTPHPGEFKRLIGETASDFELLQKQKEFSFRYNAYVVLKRAHTCITCPDGEVYFNSTGNPGMATAGSGDVLTGIITGLLAQGYDSKQACVLGVFLHGLAGDLAAEQLSQENLIARHIIEFLGEAFKKIGSTSLIV